MLIHGEVEAWSFEGQGVEGVDEPVTLAGGDFVGAAALSDLQCRSAPPRCPENAASISFCELFALRRAAAVGLLGSLAPELKAEWLSLTARVAEGVVRDDESGAHGSEAEATPGIDNVLASKIEELRLKESEISALRAGADALRADIVSLMSSLNRTNEPLS